MKDEQYRKIITSTQWSNLRAKKIAANPLCEDCLLDDKTTMATEVHHITPIQRGKSIAEMKRLAYDYHNLRSLCEDCHKKAHERLGRMNKANIRKMKEIEKKRFIDTWLGGERINSGA